MIAAHYLDAYRAAPDADDAPEIKAQAHARCSPARASAPPRSAANDEAAALLRASGRAQRTSPLDRGGAPRARRRLTAWALRPGEQARGRSTSVRSSSSRPRA